MSKSSNVPEKAAAGVVKAMMRDEMQRLCRRPLAFSQEDLRPVRDAFEAELVRGHQGARRVFRVKLSRVNATNWKLNRD